MHWDPLKNDENDHSVLLLRALFNFVWSETQKRQQNAYGMKVSSHEKKKASVIVSPRESWNLELDIEPELELDFELLFELYLFFIFTNYAGSWYNHISY